MRRVRLALVLAGLAALAALVLLLPWGVSDFRSREFALVGIWFIALVGLNVLTGYSGQITLGHGAFMAIGGYTTAILVYHAGIRDLWTIPIAGLVSGACGFAFGIPALRLSGLYLALATFGVAVALPAVAKKWESLTGGGTGLNLFGRKQMTGTIGGVDVLGLHLSPNRWLYYLTWAIAAVLLVAAWLLLRGRVGRAFRAIRDSEIAAVSSGIHLPTYKTLAFAVSAFYAGVAGSLYVTASAFVNPLTFQVTLSITLLIGAVVAGLGSLSGIVFGAFFIQYLPIWAQDLSQEPGVPAVIYGLVLIAVMLVLPRGAAGVLRRALKALTGRLYTRPT